jgi:hypothetical protein
VEAIELGRMAPDQQNTVLFNVIVAETVATDSAKQVQLTLIALNRYKTFKDWH